MIVEGDDLEPIGVCDKVGRRTVVNSHGITVMRWCMSCQRHKVDGRKIGRVKCSLIDEWRDNRHVCAVWKMAHYLDRVGDPARQKMWKPKAYFDWLLNVMPPADEMKGMYERWQEQTRGNDDEA